MKPRAAQAVSEAQVNRASEIAESDDPPSRYSARDETCLIEPKLTHRYLIFHSRLFLFASSNRLASGCASSPGLAEATSLEV
jgi:hypothetical protein